MKDQVRIDWIAALRSGDFTQGFDQLADKDGNYCCLGVLCELAVRDGVTTKARVVARTEEERAADLEADELEDHYYDIDYDIDGDSGDSFKCADIEVPVGSWFYLDGQKRPIGGELPMEVREWAGINDNTRIKFLDGGLFATLAEANDSHRLTFPLIADAIERLREGEEPQGQDPEDQDE